MLVFGSTTCHNYPHVLPSCLESLIHPMLPDQRRQAILNLLERLGFASFAQLVEETGTSESTVRRDLENLERQGHARYTRGGAAYVGEKISNFDDRTGTAWREKMAIGKVAAGLIGSGESVLLDGGTTTLEVARNLVGKSLQVATNSLPVVNLLATQPQIELLMIGGYLYPKTGVALGPLAIAGLAKIRVRRLVISVGGITPSGLFNSNTLLADTERAMLDVADEVVVVTDSSKLGRSALAHLCGLERVQRLVVDSGITDDWRTNLEQLGIEVLIADPVGISAETPSNPPRPIPEE